jgi:hypothetical protein
VLSCTVVRDWPRPKACSKERDASQSTPVLHPTAWASAKQHQQHGSVRGNINTMGQCEATSTTWVSAKQHQQHGSVRGNISKQ